MKAIYPGRFDPVTNGHLDIVRRAATLFGQVTVGVYRLPETACLFDVDERVDMLKKAVGWIDAVNVKAFDGLVVDFARKEGATILVRGIRAVTDFEAELDMAPELESVYLMTSLEHLFVSGHRIREVASLGSDVGELVPFHVAKALRERFET